MKKFTGPLGQKQERRRQGLLQTNAERRALYMTLAAEEDENLNLLSDHYGVSRGDYQSLCLALARDFVPCFQVSRKAGRKQKWNGWVAGVLVVEMERKIEKGNPAKGIAWAARQVAKQDPWATFIETRVEEDEYANPPEVLRTQYMNWRQSKFAKVLRDAFGGYKADNDIAGWESVAFDLVRNPGSD